MSLGDLGIHFPHALFSTLPHNSYPGAIKLKKSAAAAPTQKSAEPPKVEQVDFRAMLKPSAKK